MTMPNDKAISVLTVVFANELSQREIPYFRGAVLSKVPRELDVFHNHSGDTLKYRYPLIQYKRINNHAAIVCIGEGTQAIGNFFAACDFHLQIGRRSELFAIASMKGGKVNLAIGGTKHYVIRKWLALNGENYDKFMNNPVVDEKMQILRRTLIGNMLSFCSGLGVRVTQEIECDITQVIDMELYSFKGVRMMGLDIEFSTNLTLPDFVGLGKGVSLGYGMIKQI